MTFLILTNERKVIARSRVRTANRVGGFENFRALKDAENARPGQRVIDAPGAFKEDVTKVEVDLDTNQAGHEDSPDKEDEPPPLKGRKANNTVHEIKVETVEDEEMDAPHIDEDAEEMFSLPPSNKDGVHRHGEDTTFATIDVSELLRRSFITLPDEDGEQHRAIIEEVKATGESIADKTEPLFKF